MPRSLFGDRMPPKAGCLHREGAMALHGFGRHPIAEQAPRHLVSIARSIAQKVEAGTAETGCRAAGAALRHAHHQIQRIVAVAAVEEEESRPLHHTVVVP